MRINIFLRNPNKLGNFSLEIFYNELFSQLRETVNVRLVILPFKNRGIINRIFNIFFCYMNQADINHLVGDISYCSLMLNKKRLVLTILDFVSLYQNKKIKKFLLKKFLFQIPINKASKTIFISEATRIDAKKFLNKEIINSEIIPVTVSSTFFNYCHTNKKKDFAKKFLMIGTAPNKNIERVAMALEGIDLSLTIIGKLNSSQRSQLINCNINFVELDFALSEDEVIIQYKNADVLIFTSTLEGFGMPIIEANLMNVCVITSNVSSMPFVAGNSALLCDPFSVKSIKNAILKIIDNKQLREDLIDLGKENAKRFNLNNLCSHHIEIYKSIVS